ncbi:MAG TPA: HEAT repeat domain-containing protein [Thermoanaerobaculia bacterium]|nr:HEAT repeat domain-containing protein [Thermoanaerobaculia bacterium]
MDVSVIVRFHDEERYLEAVLRAIRAQRLPGRFEILAVDNDSRDGSRRIAERWADRVLTLSTYRPGRALNLAIEHARGRHVAVLSAHTIPAGDDWLARLRAPLDAPRLAGVYGGQLYNLHSRFLDKRDLDIFSTLEPRTERRDSDFWNANSMFPRSVWEQQRFDETVYELEDHHWTKRLLPRGYEVRFEPRALVYHYSHLDRLDREFLPPSPLSDDERIDEALAELADPAAGWSRVMVAGLTLSSLTRAPGIGRAVPALGRHLADHWDFDVRWRMAQALGKIPGRDAIRHLVGALTDRSFYPRDEAAWALARHGATAVPEILAAVPRLPADCRPFAALALGLSGTERGQREGVALLAGDAGGGLAADSPRERRDAAYFAGELAGATPAVRLVPRLASLIDGGPELARVACWALGCFAGRAAVDWRPILRHAGQHPDPLVRFEAVVALGKRARAGGAAGELLRPLLAACGDPQGRVRYGAVQSLRLLAEAGLPTPVPAWLEDDPDFGVRYESALLAAAGTMPAPPSAAWRTTGAAVGEEHGGSSRP